MIRVTIASKLTTKLEDMFLQIPPATLAERFVISARVAWAVVSGMNRSSKTIIHAAYQYAFSAGESSSVTSRGMTSVGMSLERFSRWFARQVLNATRAQT